MFETRTITDLCSIARAGGGIDIDVGMRQSADLAALARAAEQGKATIIMRGLGSRLTTDLVSIAQAGKGCVIFADKLK